MPQKLEGAHGSRSDGSQPKVRRREWRSTQRLRRVFTETAMMPSEKLRQAKQMVDIKEQVLL
jgi:hypothetical protein